MNTFPTLQTRRCFLRKILQNEIPMLRQIIDDELFQRFLPELYDTVKTEDGLILLLRHFDTYVQNNDGLLWGIEIESEFAGFVAFMDISYDPILFYAMHPHYRNLGYAKEAVSKVVRFFIEEYPNLNLHTEVYNDNHASIAILQSCGFNVSGKENEKIMLTL